MVPIREKRKPHYDLDGLKQLIHEKRFMITASSERSAFSLGFTRHEILATVLGLTKSDFYKSMTTHHSHKIWQDVYKPRVEKEGEGLILYVKLQESADRQCVVISFKPKLCTSQ